MENWKLQVFKIELRKLITYRADFWVNFIGRTVLTFVIFYYLWESIYLSKKVESLKGFTLNKMTLYYLIIPLIFRMQQGESIGSMSREIYDGSLNKYLLYPVNFYTYKITTYLAHATFYFLQALFLLIVFNLFLHDPFVYQFNLVNLIFFTLTCYLATLTCFAMSSIPEIISFWADNVWSLALIIRFTASFLGGAMVPLVFFPDNIQELLSYTPFPYMITLPINILFNDYTYTELIKASVILVFWYLIFMIISKAIWKNGKYQYTGVGI